MNRVNEVSENLESRTVHEHSLVDRLGDPDYLPSESELCAAATLQVGRYVGRKVVDGTKYVLREFLKIYNTHYS